MIGPRILFLRAGSTNAVAVLASWRPRALAARLDAESLVPLHLVAVAPHAFLSLRELLPLFCAEHQRGPWHLLQGRLAHFLNTHPHWLVAGAHEAPRGGQGDGVEAATAAPSQSVEKAAPAATAEGDGPMSAAGPVAVMAMGSNSPERASDLEQGLNGNEPAAPLRGPRLPGAGQESPAPFTLIAGGR